VQGPADLLVEEIGNSARVPRTGIVNDEYLSSHFVTS
jgi:hypothetical protein